MTFAHPWVLFLLLVPLALCFREVYTKGFRVPVPLDHGAQRPGAWWGRLLLGANLVPALTLAAATAILAGPTRSGIPKSERKMTNIELCLDVSGSMTSEFGDGNRYDAAMAAITEFTNKRKGDAFGLTIFGNEVLRWVPLTKDLSAIASATPFLRPSLLPSHFGGTEIGKGLLFCKETLSHTEKDADRMIILLSDGVSFDIQGEDAQRVGMELAAEDIVLYSIFIGSGEATDQLYGVTGPTGGEVFACDDPDGLEQIFSHIDKMRPAVFKPKGAVQVYDYTWMAWTGLGLLGLYLLTLLGMRYTPW